MEQVPPVGATGGAQPARSGRTRTTRGDRNPDDRRRQAEAVTLRQGREAHDGGDDREGPLEALLPPSAERDGESGAPTVDHPRKTGRARRRRAWPTRCRARRAAGAPRPPQPLVDQAAGVSSGCARAEISDQQQREDDQDAATPGRDAALAPLVVAEEVADRADGDADGGGQRRPLLVLAGGPRRVGQEKPSPVTAPPSTIGTPAQTAVSAPARTTSPQTGVCRAHPSPTPA